MIASAYLSRTTGFIDGNWWQNDAGAHLSVTNPASGARLASIPVMGRTETLLAIKAAKSALAYRTRETARRDWLAKIAASIECNSQELGRIITLEHGKPHREAIAEADYAASFFRFYASIIDEVRSTTLDVKPKQHTWNINFRPAGVVGLISPWNFPLAMIAKKIAAALAADCTCVVKPSSRTPLASIALFNFFEHLDLPPGKVNLVIGPADEITNVLCEHPDVRVISFTGSTSVGKGLMSRASSQLKRLSLELGGNAPFIVFENANLRQAVSQLVENKFRASGQTCVCANRVYVHADVYDQFTQMLTAVTDDLVVGDGLAPNVDLGPLIDDAAYEKVKAHIDDALSCGAVLVGRHQVPDSNAVNRRFVPPIVLAGATDQMKCAKEETFGPVIPLIKFSEDHEVVRRANATEFGLAAYLFTSDLERAQRIVDQLNFGHVGINTGTGPTAEAPFGGMKCSGFGREGGLEGLREFVEPQTVVLPFAKH